MFVPSCVHHIVENQVCTLSINHNWGNAYNIYDMSAMLLSDLRAARLAIADVRDMEGWHAQCDVLVKVYMYICIYPYSFACYAGKDDE